MTSFRWAELVDVLEGEEPVVFYTGAGISREAGLDTFRGENGLWEKYDMEEVATPQAFRRNPERVWEFYRRRRRQLSDVEPAWAHQCLAELEKDHPEVRVITQNVDDLHERAGQEKLVHLHGEIAYDRCSECGFRQKASLAEKPPGCPECGGLMRPDVVWFGESLEPEVTQKVDEWLREVDLVCVVGSSLTVAPASALPDRAKRHGAWVCEVNPNPSDGVDISPEQRFSAGANDFFRTLVQKQ